MYDYIKGILTSKTISPKGCFATVETNSGVGFFIEVTKRDYSSFINIDEQIKLYTVLIHREDKMSLCGFLKKGARDIFNILTSVSGVGSKMALTLIDEFEETELIGLVIDGNYKALTRAKGVGPKLAQKIILELKDKLINYQEIEPIQISDSVQNSESVDTAQTVLLSLGYEKNEIKSALSKALAIVPDNSDTEGILKEALKLLSV